MRSDQGSDNHPRQRGVRLNKYIADAGVCSRREADKLIEAGQIKVNGKVETQLGTRIQPKDKVEYRNKTLSREKLVYLLLNKPKGYITTVSDDRDRRTVMDLVGKACDERIYPVGRLDRNTTGVLLFTNDGELAKKLTHPKHEVEKIYRVELNDSFKASDLDKLKAGIELEDGFIKPDEVAMLEDSNKSVGISLHSGKNRIVRRIFESLGYEVVRLDRTFFAGLTKKALPRGKWRFLDNKEVHNLKRRS